MKNFILKYWAYIIFTCGAVILSRLVVIDPNLSNYDKNYYLLALASTFITFFIIKKIGIEKVVERFNIVRFLVILVAVILLKFVLSFH